MTNKVPLVLWSGGLDSTFLMWHLLHTTDVDFVYLNGGQYASKIAQEKKACDAMLPLLNKGEFKAREISCRSFGSIASGNSITWSQPVPWLFGALTVVDANRHSSVQIAYVQGDEIVAVKDQLHQAWDGLVGLCKPSHIPLALPLLLTPKIQILTTLPKELYDLIWVCENPYEEGEGAVSPCRTRCNSCVEHATQLHKFKLLGWRPDQLGSRADKYVIHSFYNKVV